MATFSTPQSSVQSDYWVGNSYATIKRGEQNLFGTLNNLHKGMGVGIGWILLADTLAGSMVLLSLTGVVLWTQLHRRRLVGMGISLLSLSLLVGLGLAAG